MCQGAETWRCLFPIWRFATWPHWRRRPRAVTQLSFPTGRGRGIRCSKTDWVIVETFGRGRFIRYYLGYSTIKLSASARLLLGETLTGRATQQPNHLSEKNGVPFCWTAKWVRTTPTDFPVVSCQSFLQKFRKTPFPFYAFSPQEQG